MAEFSVEQARDFYDRFGRKQDWQAFYENPAMQALIDHAAFGDSHRVIEFGCGTGRFAQRLLREDLSADATYLGIDVSCTMVRLAQQRLAPWPARAEVRLSDGRAAIQESDTSADRFVSTYVFDLLSTVQIHEVLKEAHRLLQHQGLLCLVSLTQGRGVFGRLVCSSWQKLHGFSPKMVGGCRPIDVTEFVHSDWLVSYLDSVSSFGITSQILIASPRDAS
jgi:ubiquinone/menaquinone biosynthesis C-methylase UbiE